MAVTPAMPVFCEKWIADTTDLSACELGAYFSAVMHQWMHGSLPADMNKCLQIMHLWGENASSIALALLKRYFLQLENGTWINRKSMVVREKVAHNSIVFKERAQKAAAARWRGHVAKRPTLRDASSIASSNALKALQQPPLSPSQAQGTPPSRPQLVARAEARHSPPVRKAAKRQSASKRPQAAQTGLPLQGGSPAPRGAMAGAAKHGQKRPPNSVNTPQDPRFDQVANEIRNSYYPQVTGSSAPCPWSQRAKAGLSRMLAACEGHTIEDFRRMLHHRAEAVGLGAVNGAAQVEEWIEQLPRFLLGPVNAFGDPIAAGPVRATVGL